METNKATIVRKILNAITPRILKGEKNLNPILLNEIETELRRQAVLFYASGNDEAASELSSFIENRPNFKIWWNGYLHMMQQSSNPKTETLIFSDKKGIENYEKHLISMEVVLERARKRIELELKQNEKN